MMICNISAGCIAMEYGFNGPNYCIVSACASGLHGIGEAFLKIVHDECDIMVCGGAEAAVSETVANAIRTVARVPLDATTRLVGSVEGGVNSADFVDYLEINNSGDAPCTAWDDVRDADGDGRLDTFIQIDPGTPVCWDVHVVQNDFVPPMDVPQVFIATIEVRGGSGGTLLDSRDVFFLVPPVTFVAPPD